MRFAILSDIHANLEALEAVFVDCVARGIRRYFCAGDMIGYGPNPNECIHLLNKYKTECVLGNHEWAVMEKIPLDHFNESAGQSIEWTRINMIQSSFDFLERFNLTLTHDMFQIVHASLNKPEAFNYIKDTNKSLDTFYLMNKNVCFIGHTHKPQMMVKNDEYILMHGSQKLELKNGCKYIVNVGSVGQPRDGNPDACYCIYDPDIAEIELRRVSYNIEKTIQKINQAGLPDNIGQRLLIGQ